jgi:hypothetical protein
LARAEFVSQNIGGRRSLLLFGKKWHLLPPFLTIEPGTVSTVYNDFHLIWDKSTVVVSKSYKKRPNLDALLQK